MNRRILSYSLGAAAVLFGLAACSSDKAVAPGGVSSAEVTQASRDDAGQSAAMTVDELALNDDAAQAAPNIVKGGAAAADVAGVIVICTGPGPGPGGIGNGWYTCTKDRENGLMVVRWIRFWEGTSFGLAWDPLKTDSVNHFWTVDGTIGPTAALDKTYTVDDSAGATMNVIRPPEGGFQRHSWSGTADRHQSAAWSRNGEPRTFTHTAFDTVAAVLFQMPRRLNPFPLSGSITRNETGVFTAPGFTKTVTRRFVVTFNGTRIAQLQDGTVTCDLDLVTHVVSNCH